MKRNGRGLAAECADIIEQHIIKSYSASYVYVYIANEPATLITVDGDVLSLCSLPNSASQ